MDEDRMAAARRQFDAEVVYLNTATMGLPTRSTLQALHEAQDAWRAGRSDAVAFDAALRSARASYARLVQTPETTVAVGSQVSVFVGLVAASLPAGSEVLTATGDFTSVLFPFHVQAARDVRVREVPLSELAEA